MRDVMDDGDVSFPRFCSLKSLYIGFHWTLGFICQLLKSFIFI